MDISPPSDALRQPGLPAPTLVVPVVKPSAPPKHFLAAFFLSFFLGVFGADRFYLGKYWGGIAKLLTFGLFGIGAIVDLALIMNGAMRDANDRPLVGYEEYKSLAKRTVAWVTIGVTAVVVVNVVILAIAVQQLISQFQSSFSGSGLQGGSGGSSQSIESLLSL